MAAINSPTNTSGNTISFSDSASWNVSSGSTTQTVKIANDTSGQTLSFGNSGPSVSSDKCGHPTASGGPCELEGSFDDGHCHWHTDEQCYRPTADGSPCELPGHMPDGACHIHSVGCNESLTHRGVEKALFHTVKGAYRWLGLHSDMPGSFSIQPESAAIIAAQAGRAYILATGETYDRERSLNDIEDRHMSEVGVIDKLIEWIKSGFNSPEEFEPDTGVITLDEFKDAIKRAWNKTDKENHLAGARVAVAASEAYLGKKVEME